MKLLKLWRQKWKWVPKSDGIKAYVLISDENGKFEITGLMLKENII